MARFASLKSSSAFVRGRLQASLCENRKRTRSIRSRYAVAPVGLGWDKSLIEPIFTYHDSGVYRARAEPRSLVNQDIWTGSEFYVKPETGDDGNSGADWDNAFRNIHAAITAGNATASPYAIYIDADEDAQESSFSSNGSVQPSQDMALVGVAGARDRARYISGKTEDEPTWTLDSGTMYTTSVSSTKRILNMDVLDDYGLPADLDQVADSTACSSTDNSFAISGSTVYVNIGEDPTGKLMVLRNFNTSGNWSNDVDIYIENFEIWGGGQGCFPLNSTTSSRNIIGKNVRFIAPASANSGSAPKDCFTVNENSGLIAFFESEASLGHKDGWNFHHNNTTGNCYVLLVSCSGYKNGSEADSSSNNFTTHDDITAIAVGCNFAEVNEGSDVHCIQDTRTWLFDCDVKSRDPDDTSTCFQCSNSGFMWIEQGSADAQGGATSNLTIEANGGTVYTRNLDIIAGLTSAYSGGSIGSF